MKVYKRFFKRPLDVAASAVGLLALSPLLGGVALWLHWANKGAGVIYRQERPGYKGRPFSILKFKSMTDERGADGQLLPNEQRVTRAGRLIRKTSVDELPQLWNVLRGDMSLIGPRPLPVRYLELYSPEQARRHDVRPGITGWAQVNGRNNISWTRKFQYDVEYVDRLSLAFDLVIIFKTIQKIIRRADIDAGDGRVGGIGFDGTN